MIRNPWSMAKNRGCWGWGSFITEKLNYSLWLGLVGLVLHIVTGDVTLSAIQTWQWNLLLHFFEWMCFSQLNMQQSRHLWMLVPLKTIYLSGNQARRSGQLNNTWVTIPLDNQRVAKKYDKQKKYWTHVFQNMIIIDDKNLLINEKHMIVAIEAIRNIK